jgi:hypothetical protein
VAIIGGLRTRFIQDSFFAMLEDALTQLGWFDAERDHSPITMIDGDIAETDTENREIPIAFNTLSVSWDSYFDNDWEMGSTLVEANQLCYVDFYAEDDSVGQHLIYDAMAIVSGRMPSIGRDSATFDVYDYSLATPARIFYCELRDPLVDRARTVIKPWQRHWWSLQVRVIDYFGDEDDTDLLSV